VVFVATAGVLAAASVAGLISFTHDRWTGEPLKLTDVELALVSVIFGGAVVLIGRRWGSHLPVKMAVVVLAGIAGGAEFAISSATDSAEHRRSMATSECRQLLGVAASAEQVAACVPVALACDREDRREAGEGQVILWVGLNPCIEEGVARATSRPRGP